MSWAMSDLKLAIRSLFGAAEDSSSTVSGLVSQVVRKHHVYNWPIAVKAASLANAATRLTAQTASLSLSQPQANRCIYMADKQARVTELSFAQYISSTLSATLTMSWTLVVQKRGKGTGTFSGTWSVTTFVGGLTSASTKPSFSNSYSHVTQNVAFAPNRLLLARTPSKLLLKRGDILTAKVLKGSGHADDSGAIFPGGTLKITVEEE